ncbi:hypothetical protein [Micromonospora sp. DT62]|uniref:hypothetical protein n=1 Tax=Micromonospora sp. DT62 TaxID=3416521 RepID=UPI003CF7BFAB
MSSYRDPAPQGDVFPSEEEIDPTGIGPAAPAGAYPAGTTPRPKPAPPPTPPPRPVPHPGPAPRVGRA